MSVDEGTNLYKKEFSPALRDLLSPGKAVRLDYGGKNRNNEIRHIRAVVDGEFIVYRVWSRRKGWMYSISWYYSFLFDYKCGNLRPYKTKEDQSS